MGIFKKMFSKERMDTEHKGDGVGILFDWDAVGDGVRAWQIFCESCDPKHLAENIVLMTDVLMEDCKIEIKALANRQHAYCIGLPETHGEQTKYVHNAMLSNAAKFLLPETPFVPPALVGPWGTPIGRINFEGEFTLYDGDFLWVILRAARAKWNCSVSAKELNRFLFAIKGCCPITDDEMAIFAQAIGAHRLEQALDTFRTDYTRSLINRPEDERSASQKKCEEFVAQLKHAIGRK
jgi:hypothetical protein